MKEIEFKDNFIATFLATWCACNHNDYCQLGMQESLSNPPVEDAVFLADEAWLSYLKNYPITKSRLP